MKGEAMTITEFLLARIAEDEAVANEVSADRNGNFTGGELWAAETNGWVAVGASAERVLAECAAKRAIVQTVGGWRHDYNDEDMWYSCPLAVAVGETEPGSGYYGDDDAVCRCGLEARQLAILSPLVAVYADHPDYQPEWAL